MTGTVILYCSDTCLYTSGYSVSQGVCPLGKDCQGFDHMNNIFCNIDNVPGPTNVIVLDSVCIIYKERENDWKQKYLSVCQAKNSRVCRRVVL
jgi:hypothetical protein